MSIHTLYSMRTALQDASLFAPQIGGASWAPWRSLLLAICGEPLTDAELADFRTLTNRATTPSELAREFWAVHWQAGRQKPLHGHPGCISSRLPGPSRNFGAWRARPGSNHRGKSRS